MWGADCLYPRASLHAVMALGRLLGSLKKPRETIEAHYETRKKRLRKTAFSVLAWIINGQTRTVMTFEENEVYARM